MTAENLIRYGGASILIAGLLYVFLGFAPIASLDSVQSGVWLVFQWVATAHHFFLLFGLFAVFVYQFYAAGALGFIAFLVLAIGNLAFAGAGAVFTTIVPRLAAEPVAHSTLSCIWAFSRDPALADCQGGAFAEFGAWDLASANITMLGTILLGIAIIRAKVLPTIAGWLMIVGWIGTFLGWFVVPLPSYIVNSFVPVIGIGMVWIGIAIRTTKGTAPRRIRD